MKLKTLLITLLMLLPSLLANAKMPFSFNLVQTPSDEVVKEKDDDDEKWRRPSRPISCSISSEGVVIAGVEDEILTFEIAYAEDGGCLLSTDDEKEFIEVLATLPADTYQIVFLTEDYRFVGYIGID